MRISATFVILLFQGRGTLAQCYDPSPAFPMPVWGSGGSSLTPAVKEIESGIAKIISKMEYDASSFSIDLTSSSETIWAHYHTARQRNDSRPGTNKVGGRSIYRISAVTKVFTVFGILQQHEANKLSLDDPVTKYLPELEGAIAWEKITLRTLASQLSGIPREFAHSDFINQLSDPVAHGLPPANKDTVPACDEYNNYLPCKRADLIKAAKRIKPVFAPNHKSTYSNVAYEILGLVLEKVTGVDYNQYLKQAIFDPLGMNSTSGDIPPSDKNVVYPIWSKGANYWGIDEGVQNSTAGVYSTSSDMSRFLAYILSRSDSVVTGVNWLLPVSWSTGFRNFYGMPWEILRTEKVLKHSQRPVTFVTKSGGMPGYYSRITLMPEYGLGLTILVGGETELLSELLELITTSLVRHADTSLWQELEEIYAGHYSAADPSLNSSITLACSPETGLMVTSFISNSTDVLSGVFGLNLRSSYAQLTPTGLHGDLSAKDGDIWRMNAVPKRLSEDSNSVWQDLCGTDIDTSRYAGIPANELVFWHKRKEIELPAWKVTLKLQRRERVVNVPFTVQS